MAIKDDNKRISVKFTKDEYDILEKLAKKENRSVSNLVGTLTKKHLENHIQPNDLLEIHSTNNKE